jgi:inner membrane protein involved in colicin E2 resistance
MSALPRLDYCKPGGGGDEWDVFAGGAEKLEAKRVFVLALLGLDVVMWFLLRSEDSALLLGSAVLALALFAVMYLTRHFDWYSLSQPKHRAARRAG